MNKVTMDSVGFTDASFIMGVYGENAFGPQGNISLQYHLWPSGQIVSNAEQHFFCLWGKLQTIFFNFSLINCVFLKICVLKCILSVSDPPRFSPRYIGLFRATAHVQTWFRKRLAKQTERRGERTEMERRHRSRAEKRRKRNTESLRQNY